jgi:hypothetical protein
LRASVTEEAALREPLSEPRRRLSAAVAANLHGVWAKWERGLEQLAALDKEVSAFCAQPHPYTIHSHEDQKEGRYRFEIYPAWQPGVPWRWGAIIGEIVHDFRSALGAWVTMPAERRFAPFQGINSSAAIARMAAERLSGRR